MPISVRVAVAVLVVMIAYPASPQTSRESEGVAFVEKFFEAFDRRDLKSLEAAFSPEATIVHDDGVQQTVSELIATIRNAKSWDARRRTISGCNTQTYGVVVVVGCLNHVEFIKAGHPSTDQTYNETWVLERTKQGLRAIRSHYSLVVKKKHSED